MPQRLERQGRCKASPLDAGAVCFARIPEAAPAECEELPKNTVKLKLGMAA